MGDAGRSEGESVAMHIWRWGAWGHWGLPLSILGPGWEYSPLCIKGSVPLELGSLDAYGPGLRPTTQSRACSGPW